mmetsp:Transcript_55672/g.103014  ORF Transcript_55672/g.103014 Transcript_55672/m.103014 type:complete len:220 (-) Transcript_55672:454-1113(-)
MGRLWQLFPKGQALSSSFSAFQQTRANKSRVQDPVSSFRSCLFSTGFSRVGSTPEPGCQSSTTRGLACVGQAATTTSTCRWTCTPAATIPPSSTVLSATAATAAAAAASSAAVAKATAAAAGQAAAATGLARCGSSCRLAWRAGSVTGTHSCCEAATAAETATAAATSATATAAEVKHKHLIGGRISNTGWAWSRGTHDRYIRDWWLLGTPITAHANQF